MFVFFDFDGVIIDTERSIFKYFQKILKKENIELSDLDFKKKIGNTSEDFLRQVTDLPTKKIYEIASKRRDDFIDDISHYHLVRGVDSQILRLSKKYRLAVCSSSYTDLIVPALKHFGLFDKFEFILGAENINLYKPNPEIYLKAVDKMKKKGETSGYVIEDSISGVLAGKRANLSVVAITTSFLKNELGAADYIIDSFKELEKIILT